LNEQTTTEQTADASLAPQEQRSGMMAAHLLGILGIIGAGIYWLIVKDKSEKSFVQDQAREVLNFEINIFVIGIVFFILTMIVGINLSAIVSLVNLVACIMAAIKANKGEKYRYPYVYRFLNK